MPTHHSRHALIVAAALLLGLVGCGPGERFVPAQGKLLVGTRAPVGARITLAPLGEQKDSAPQASGVVDASGVYILTTYDPATRTVHQGVRPGKYAVVVTWIPEITAANLDAGLTVGDRLHGRYRDPATTTLRVEIGENATELPTITLPESDLKARPR